MHFTILTKLAILTELTILTYNIYNVRVSGARQRTLRMRREGYSSRLVCMYVSHAHVILAVRAIKSVTKDTVVLNVRFAAIL